MNQEQRDAQMVHDPNSAFLAKIGIPRRTASTITDAELDVLYAEVVDLRAKLAGVVALRAKRGGAA